ncbi:MAG: bifunctional transaldolase/phosoglucose isomerase [Ardenticatenaceae bacterium]|nr:bifunctional transaldolase/phosoglucose isomerase [Anaerolineales bacterium]MCB8941815.1 bifunctional transaldolase/phosoglucose isomerase [Ardenticatenaceae bacterium]MCB8972927.1 bifunctional transaldolase/phosoglucose isomerase [Ardenticatenaceae bacterium]
MSKLHELFTLGQSVWYDNISRDLLASGAMQTLIDDGVVGVTSNPSIFEKAIAKSSDYDGAIRELAQAGKSTNDIYEAMALEDIGAAADLFRPVYEKTGGVDGYISLEVSPTLARDTKGTIAEARRLFAALNRPNIMIKVPATPEGIPAIETLIADGININVTLIFALSSYEDVMNAYISGLEKRLAAGQPIDNISSVASFFVSRVDTAVDKALAAKGNTNLQGKIAIANAQIAYARFQQLFGEARWRVLAEKGGRVQRPLWASTSTKNPAYPDTLYVDTLIGADTVNTVPPDTVEAFKDHGTVAITLTQGVEDAAGQLDALANLGISLDEITEQLQVDGVNSFAKAFEGLMASIEGKCTAVLSKLAGFEASLGDFESRVAEIEAKLANEKITERIWQHDHTVWQDDPTEITNRLGWLHTPKTMAAEVERINQFVAEVKAAGFTEVMLLGMGGSSLAPELFAKVFGTAVSGLPLRVLDSTDATAVKTYAETADLAHTLFIVSTKSGGTVETFSFFKYFYNRVADLVGADKAGQQFVAITDPGSGLVKTANKYNFRTIFENDPNIGGRYSVISFFGLVPAALVGVDVALLLERAQAATQSPTATQLGAILGTLAQQGRDKVTLITSEQLASFGDWVEQLIAESTGKNGKGILPVVGEPLYPPNAYGDDRLFVHLRLAGDESYATAVDQLLAKGYPVIDFYLQDLYDLGGQFFIWELATAVAGHVLGIQPFDQPNVESAKVLARKMVATYQETGKLPQLDSAEPTAANLQNFVAQAKPGDYISIHAYVPPTPETDMLLQTLRTQLLKQTRCATTVGYGPRFLHSTGQLHKGDGGNGLFIQFTSDPVEDVAIPDEAGSAASGMSFGLLKQSQALGDAQALLDENRRLIRFELGTAVDQKLQKLLD